MKKFLKRIMTSTGYLLVAIPLFFSEMTYALPTGTTISYNNNNLYITTDGHAVLSLSNVSAYAVSAWGTVFAITENGMLMHSNTGANGSYARLLSNISHFAFGPHGTVVALAKNGVVYSIGPQPSTAVKKISASALKINSGNGNVYILQNNGLLLSSKTGDAGTFTVVTAHYRKFTWTAKDIVNFVINKSGILYALDKEGTLWTLNGNGLGIYTTNVKSIGLTSNGKSITGTYLLTQAPIIASAVMTAIRTQPSLIPDIFSLYQKVFTNLLKPNTLDRDAVALAFATVVSYQTATYGDDTPGLNYGSLSSIFTDAHLECRSYSQLTELMYYQYLRSPSSTWKLYHTGFTSQSRVPSPFGDHIQIIAISSNGKYLLLDPTIALVAEIPFSSNSLSQLFLTKTFLPVTTPAKSIHYWATRTVSADFTAFEMAVIDALAKGMYSIDSLSFIVDLELSTWYLGITPTTTMVGMVGQTLYMLPPGDLPRGGSWCTMGEIMGAFNSYGDGFYNMYDTDGNLCTCGAGKCTMN